MTAGQKAWMAARPSRLDLEEAWSTLHAAGIEVIGDISLSAIGDTVRGSPPYAPDRYRDAEVRLAELVLVMRAEVVKWTDMP